MTVGIVVNKAYVNLNIKEQVASNKSRSPLKIILQLKQKVFIKVIKMSS